MTKNLQQRFPRVCFYFVEIYYIFFCLCLDPEDRESTITLQKWTNSPTLQWICMQKCSWETLVYFDPWFWSSWISTHHDLHRTHAIIKNTHTYTADDHTACENSTGSGGGTKGQSSRNAALMARLLLFTTNLANQMLTPWTANLELTGMEI